MIKFIVGVISLRIKIKRNASVSEPTTLGSSFRNEIQFRSETNRKNLHLLSLSSAQKENLPSALSPLGARLL